MSFEEVTVVGAGLAGSECAWQLAERGVNVTLYEQKPTKRTPAQHLDTFAELVCSNSFRGASLSNAVGLIKEEMRRAGSMIMAVADEVEVPAGGAFAVDRDKFSQEVTRRIRNHARITVVETEVTALPVARPCVVATGPLTGDALALSIAEAVGTKHLAYYDAIAPIVTAESINWERVFRASRYDKGGDDAYVNCPLNKEEYYAFVAALLAAEKVKPKDFEDIRYFEGCLPIEVMAERGERTLAFGPMKPVGLTDPKTGRWPYAVVQLRPEDDPATCYNIVGFQTRMTWPEQKRVLAMIPGLENAEYARLGSVHRNTFVNSPVALDDAYQLRAQPGVFLAGQVSGVEGYVESSASGLVMGIYLAHGADALMLPPRDTALGALMHHLRKPHDNFQPSNVVWSMFRELINTTGKKKLGKRERGAMYAERALTALEPWLDISGARARGRTKLTIETLHETVE